MPSFLSVDLRERVVACVLSGRSCREAASRFGVSAASVSRWAARLRQDGQVAPRPMGRAHVSYRVEGAGRADPGGCRRKPTIVLLRPGNVVVLDSLCVHKVTGVHEAVEAAGAPAVLPTYSPEFNPIEQVFAKLEALLRSAAARTVTDLHQATQAAFGRFTRRSAATTSPRRAMRTMLPSQPDRERL